MHEKTGRETGRWEAKPPGCPQRTETVVPLWPWKERPAAAVW